VRVILLDDHEGMEVLEGDDALFLTDGRDGSPKFVECSECKHIIVGKNAVDGHLCPQCV